MITYKHYHSGQLFGIRYQFEKGDVLPAHSHEPELFHNIIVLKGRCRFVGEMSLSWELKAGDVFDFHGELKHSIEALETSELLHLFLNGEPESYKKLPASERQGVI